MKDKLSLKRNKSLLLTTTFSALLSNSQIINSLEWGTTFDINSNQPFSYLEINWPYWNNLLVWETDENGTLKSVDKQTLINNLNDLWYSDPENTPINIIIYSESWSKSSILEMPDYNVTISSYSTFVERIIDGKWHSKVYEYMDKNSLDINTSNGMQVLVDYLRQEISNLVWWLNSKYGLKDVDNNWIINNYDLQHNPDLHTNLGIEFEAHWYNNALLYWTEELKKEIESKILAWLKLEPNTWVSNNSNLITKPWFSIELLWDNLKIVTELNAPYALVQINNSLWENLYYWNINSNWDPLLIDKNVIADETTDFRIVISWWWPELPNILDSWIINFSDFWIEKQPDNNSTNNDTTDNVEDEADNEDNTNSADINAIDENPTFGLYSAFPNCSLEILDPFWNNILSWKTDNEWNLLNISKEDLINQLELNWYDRDTPVTIRINSWNETWYVSSIWLIPKEAMAVSTVSTLIEREINWERFKKIYSYLESNRLDPSNNQQDVPIFINYLKSSINSLVLWLNNKYWLTDINKDWEFTNYDILHFPNRHTSLNSLLESSWYNYSLLNGTESEKLNIERDILSWIVESHDISWGGNNDVQNELQGYLEPEIDLSYLTTIIDNSISNTSVDTKLQDLVNKKNSLEEEIKILQNISETWSDSEREEIQREINDLTLALNNLKSQVVSYYNNTLDASSKVLLDSTKSSHRKRQEAKNISLWINSSWWVTNKTYDEIPKNNISDWISYLKQEFNELSNELELLRQDKEEKKSRMDDYYENTFSPARDNYYDIVRIIEEAKPYKDDYDSLLNEIKSLWRLKYLWLKVWNIIDFKSVQAAINDINDKISIKWVPDLAYNPYKPNSYYDTSLSKEEDLNIFGENFKVYVLYSKSWWYPAGLWFRENNTLKKTEHVRNNQHKVEVVNYYWRKFEQKILLQKLNSLKAIETKLNDLKNQLKNKLNSFGSTESNYRNKYNQIKNAYEEAKSFYNIAKSDYNVASNLLHEKEAKLSLCESKLKTYWIKLEDIASKESEIVLKEDILIAYNYPNPEPPSYYVAMEPEEKKLYLSNLKVDLVEAKTFVNEELERQMSNIEVDYTEKISTGKYDFTGSWYYNPYSIMTDISWAILNNEPTVNDDKDWTLQKRSQWDYTLYLEYFWNKKWDYKYPITIWWESNSWLISTKKIKVYSLKELEDTSEVWVLNKIWIALRGINNLYDSWIPKENIDEKFIENLWWKDNIQEILYSEEFVNKLVNFWLNYHFKKIINAWLSKEYSKWFWEWIKDWTIWIISQPQDLYNLWNETINWTKDWLERFAHIVWLWLLKVYDTISNSDTSNKIYQAWLEDISSRWWELQKEINDVVNKFFALEDQVRYLIWMLEVIKPSQMEYYKWYLEWYTSTLVSEAIWIWYLTKNLKTSYQQVIESTPYKRFIKTLQELELQLKVAYEINKVTRNKIDLDVFKNLENWRKLYWDSFDDTLKSIYILWNRYWPKKVSLYHIINWEWDKLWNLKWWLHSMKRVEYLLKEAKIKVKYVTKEWIDDKWKLNREYSEELGYDEYMSLSDIQKQRVKIVNLSTNKTSILKNLFPRTFTDEDIALALKQAENLIKTWNSWKLVKNLDEQTFIKYCKEGWIFNSWDDQYRNLLNKFRNWWEINLWDFWYTFNKHIYEYKWLDIEIWGKYINWELSEIVKTIYP